MRGHATTDMWRQGVVAKVQALAPNLRASQTKYLPTCADMLLQYRGQQELKRPCVPSPLTPPFTPAPLFAERFLRACVCGVCVLCVRVVCVYICVCACGLRVRMSMLCVNRGALFGSIAQEPWECFVPPRLPTDWPCPSCSFVNHKPFTVCISCRK